MLEQAIRRLSRRIYLLAFHADTRTAWQQSLTPVATANWADLVAVAALERSVQWAGSEPDAIAVAAAAVGIADFAAVTVDSVNSQWPRGHLVELAGDHRSVGIHSHPQCT